MSGQPFVFKEEYFLTRPLNRRAYDLPSLVSNLEEIPAASIFCHVHMARMRPAFQRSGLLNNFASWALSGLHERRLAERLGVVDGATSPDLDQIREELIRLVKEHMGLVENGPLCLPGHEFHLCTVEGDINDIGVSARTVPELVDGLRKAGAPILSSHFYGIALRNDDGVDDVTRWLRDNGHDELAKRTSAIPRWALPMEQVREAFVTTLGGAR